MLTLQAGLTGLVDNLACYDRTLSQEEAHALIQTAPLRKEDVAEYIHFDPHLYNRGSVVRTEHYELLIVCWGPGQYSTIHDHAQSVCAFRILQGTGTEFHFARSSGGQLYPSETVRHEVGEVQSCMEEEAHQLCNLETEGLISLHLYSPPLAKCKTYGLEETPFGGYAELSDKVARRAAGLPRSC